MKKKKRILVTGGAGYIGDAVVHYILEAGHTPVVLDNLMYGGRYMRPVNFIGGDIRDYDLLSKVLPRYGGYDAIVHLAAVVGDGACAVNQPRTIEINQTATEHLAASCGPRTRLVFASTCSVYGANNDVLDEDSPTNPLSLYAGTKLEAEKEIKRLASNHVIFRLGTLYGLSAEHGRIRSDLVANILTYRAVHGEMLKVHGGEQWRPLLHVKQAAMEFANAALGKYDTGTYILAEKNYTIDGLATRIVETIGTGRIANTPRKFEDLRNYKVDAGKAKAAGFKPSFTLKGGIEEMAKAIRDGRIADVWSPEFNNARFVKASCS